jgi:hypothetical protein
MVEQNFSILDIDEAVHIQIVHLPVLGIDIDEYIRSRSVDVPAVFTVTDGSIIVGCSESAQNTQGLAPITLLSE